MLISHALVAKSRNDWIVDSGANCHNQSMFKKMKGQGSSEKVTLGDGNSLEVVGEGTVDMEMLLTDGRSRGCALKKVLYVTKLAYDLVSVSRTSEARRFVSTTQDVNSRIKGVKPLPLLQDREASTT